VIWIDDIKSFSATRMLAMLRSFPAESAPKHSE